MKKLLIFLLGLYSVSAIAMDANLDTVKKLTAQLINGKDVRIAATKVNDGLCGAAGPSYIASVSVRNFTRVLDSNGQIKLKEEWINVRKYGITAEELKKDHKQLMAEDQCLE